MMELPTPESFLGLPPLLLVVSLVLVMGPGPQEQLVDSEGIFPLTWDLLSEYHLIASVYIEAPGLHNVQVEVRQD